MKNEQHAPPKFEIIIPRLKQALEHQKNLYSKNPTHYRLIQVKRIEQMLSQWETEKQKYHEQ